MTLSRGGKDAMPRLSLAFIRPRRRWQRWLLVALSLALLGAWNVANGYFNVQRMILGRELLRLQEENLALQVQLTSLRAQLAQAQSYKVMARHARKMGFRPATPEQILYVPVAATLPAGYATTTRSARMPLLPARQQAPWERPAYRETLWEWLTRNLWLTPGGLP